MKVANLVPILVAAVIPSAVVAVEPTSSSSGVQVYENFFSNDDIETIYKNQKSSCKTASWEMQYRSSHCGATFLSKEQIRNLNQAVNGATTKDEDGEAQYVIMKTMTETTPAHVDGAMKADGSCGPSNDDVAFIFLNTNPDANFVVEGMDQPVPVKEGSLVTFPGTKFRHHMVVKSGSVKIAGPFTKAYPHRLAGASSGGGSNFIDWFISKLKRCFSKGKDPNPIRNRQLLAEHWLRGGLNEKVDVTEKDNGVTSLE